MIELEHGIWRAKDAAQAANRQRFFDDLFAVVPTYPLTFNIARRAIEDVTGRSAIPEFAAALQYQQRDHMELSIAYAKKTLDSGVKWKTH